MGIMVDIGILNPDGTLTDGAFRSFIKDVKSKLAEGKSIFPEDIACSKKTEPTAGANLLKLEDKELFPEFHADWRPRYEKMAKSLDVPGAYGLAQQTGAPACDPTALAISMGINPPPMELADAIAAVVTPPTPPDMLVILSEGEGNEELINPVKQVENIAAMNEALALPPIPPVPELPDPIIGELGYDEQFAFSTDMAMMPIMTNASLQVPTMILKIPDILGNLPLGLIEAVCQKSTENQPKTIEEADFQDACNETMLQHQVRMQSMVFIGQNIGSGMVTKGLASTPFADGGLEMIVEGEEEEEEDDGEFELFTSQMTGRRFRVLKILRELLGEPPTGKIAYPSPAFAKISNWKPVMFEKEKELLEQATKLEGELYKPGGLQDADKAAGDKLDEVLADPNATDEEKNAAAAEYDDTGAATSDAEDTVKDNKKKAETSKKERLGKPQYTTCGVLPSYILGRLGMNWDESMVKIQGLGTVSLMGGGLESVRLAGRALGCWVDGYVEGNWTGKFPGPGDIFLLTETQPVGTAKKFMRPDDCGACHIGIIYDITGKFGDGTWLTADAGQGFDSENQAASYVKRNVEPPVIPPGASKPPPLVISGEVHRGNRPPRIVGGWIDIDKVMIKKEIL